MNEQVPLSNIIFANYMIAWIHRITVPSISELSDAFSELELHWKDTRPTNLESVREKLWSWVDVNGGSGNFHDHKLLVARMILCLAYPDNRELEDMGFFEDLLSNYGISRSEINRYSPSNIPGHI